MSEQATPTLEELARHVMAAKEHVTRCATSEENARRAYDRERRDHTEARNTLARARAELDKALDA